MHGWIDIGELASIPRRGARCVKGPMGKIAVFRTQEDQVYALENRCAHKGGPLADGIVHGASVTCPLHNWVFDLNTGRALGEDEGQVASYPVKVVEGRVFLSAEMVMRAAAE